MSRNKKAEAQAPAVVVPPDMSFAGARVRRFRVAEGKSITKAGGGILEAGGAVTAEMLGGEERGGQKALDSLIDRGIVETY
jgi:hypothetical protein